MEQKSIMDQVLDELREKGKVCQLDEESSYIQFQAIDRAMEEFDSEKQRKAADSADDLAKVRLTE